MKIKSSKEDRRSVFLPILRKLSYLRAGRLFFFFLILSLLIYLLSLFRVKKIVCYSNKQNCSTQIWLELFSKLEGKSLLLFSESRLKDELLGRFVQFNDLKINYLFPDGLKVNLVEREAIGQIFYLNAEEYSFFSKDQHYFADLVRDHLGEDKVWCFDKEGKFFLESEYQPLLPAAVFLGETAPGKFLEGDEEKMAFDLEIKLKNRGLAAIFWFMGEKINRRIILVDKNWQAKLSTEKDFEGQLDSLQLILVRAKIEGKNLIEIDLRTSKPVVVFAN